MMSQRALMSCQRCERVKNPLDQFFLGQSVNCQEGTEVHPGQERRESNVFSITYSTLTVNFYIFTC